MTPARPPEGDPLSHVRCDANATGAAPPADAPLVVLRSRGAQAFDPVRFSYLEALARRAAEQPGAVQRLLASRLGRAAAAYAERFDDAHAATAHADTKVPASRSALAELVVTLDRDRLLHADAAPSAVPSSVASSAGMTSAVAHPTSAVSELRTARHFRSTWARLRIERQLVRLQACVPTNPGPLNSHRLVLRALRQMQETSPAYLARFMGHVEALMWLEQASLAAAPARAGVASVAGAPRPEPWPKPTPKPKRAGRARGA